MISCLVFLSAYDQLSSLSVCLWSAVNFFYVWPSHQVCLHITQLSSLTVSLCSAFNFFCVWPSCQVYLSAYDQLSSLSVLHMTSCQVHLTAYDLTVRSICVLTQLSSLCVTSCQVSVYGQSVKSVCVWPQLSSLSVCISPTVKSIYCLWPSCEVCLCMAHLSSLPTYDQLSSLPTYDQLSSLPTYDQLSSLPTYDQLSSLYVRIWPAVKSLCLHIISRQVCLHMTSCRVCMWPAVMSFCLHMTSCQVFLSACNQLSILTVCIWSAASLFVYRCPAVTSFCLHMFSCQLFLSAYDQLSSLSVCIWPAVKSRDVAGIAEEKRHGMGNKYIRHEREGWREREREEGERGRGRERGRERDSVSVSVCVCVCMLWKSHPNYHSLLDSLTSYPLIRSPFNGSLRCVSFLWLFCMSFLWLLLKLFLSPFHHFRRSLPFQCFLRHNRNNTPNSCLAVYIAYMFLAVWLCILHV